MGHKPGSRREALLHELCVRQGYCSTGLSADDLTEELGAGEIAEMVLRGEGLDPARSAPDDLDAYLGGVS